MYDLRLCSIVTEVLGSQLLNRKTPFGHEVLAFLQELPDYSLILDIPKNGISTFSGGRPVMVDLDIQCCLAQELGRAKMKSKSRSHGMTSILTTTSDLEFIDFRRISFVAFVCLLIFSTVQPLSERRP
jgi:ATP-dependent DNA helicase HFM1/MER3